ncbi:hypothetical protein MXB_3649 [Myxobolus squamalis]|nr:hypothetical protein MXB_3649 [Myxobolus squamalis]
MKNCCDFRHRYAILVDNIFFTKRKKAHHQENIDKLTFYVISSPEKLDRIASRLYNHLVSFIRSYKEQVILASEVMNQLLDASPPSFINLMMDDYFKMIVKLLCNDSTEYQIISSKSVLLII